MIDGSSDRIDQISALLQQFITASDKRMNTTDERIERLATRTDQRIDRLAERQERTQEQLDLLREDIDIAFQTIGLMTQNNDREMAQFRAAILENQEECRRIWQYLLGQQRNGNGD
jgi:DNA repair exonuclease SbcCD ATPase subunit